MAIENLYADGTDGTPSVSNPENAYGSPDGTFTTDTGNTNWFCRWTLDNPSGDLTTTQSVTVVVRARKDSAGGNTPDITYVDLYNGATSIDGDSTGWSVTATGTGADYTATIPSATYPTDGSNLIVEIGSSGAGGSPSSRRAVQVDSIEVQIDVAGASTQDITPAAATVSVTAPAPTVALFDQFVTPAAATVTVSTPAPAVTQPGAFGSVKAIADDQTSSGTTGTLDFGETPADGDLIVLATASLDSNDSVGPTGFTEIVQTINSGGDRLQTWWKVAASEAGSSYDITNTADQQAHVGVLYSGGANGFGLIETVDDFSSVDDSASAVTTTTIPSAAALGPNDALYVASLMFRNLGSLETITWGSGFTEDANRINSNSPNPQVHVASEVVSGATSQAVSPSWTNASDAGGIMLVAREASEALQDLSIADGAGSDDYYIVPGNSTFDATGTTMFFGDSGNQDTSFARFLLTGDLDGATIDRVYFTGTLDSQGTDVDVDIGFVDEDDPAASTTYAAANADPVTTAVVSETIPGSAGFDWISLDISTPLQEIVDSYGPLDTEAIIVVLDGRNTGTTAAREIHTYEDIGTEVPPGLWIEYTPGAGGPATQDITPAAATVTVSGLAPTVTTGAVDITPAAATITAAGLDPTVTPGTVDITPPAATITISSSSPTITTGAVDISPAAASVTVTPQAPTVTTGTVDITPGTASITVTPQAPTVTVGAVTITPAVATVSVSPPDPTIATTGAPQEVTPAPATVSVAGLDPTLSRQEFVTPAAATITVSGLDPTITTTVDVSPITARVRVGEPNRLSQDEYNQRDGQGWSQEDYCTVARTFDQDPAYSSDYRLNITVTDDFAQGDYGSGSFVDMGLNIPVVPGQTVELSAVFGEISIATEVGVQIGGRWYDSGGSQVSIATTPNGVQAVPATGTRLSSGPMVAPEGAAYFKTRIGLNQRDIGDTFWSRDHVVTTGPRVLADQSVTPAPATVSVAGLDPIVSAGQTIIQIPTATVSVSAQAPTVTVGAVDVTPAAAQVTVTGPAPTITTGAVTVLPDVAQVTITTPAPDVTTAVSVDPGVAQVTVTAQDPVLRRQELLDPEVAQVTVTTPAPTVTTGAVDVTPEVATVTVSTFDPTFILDQDIAPDVATVVVSTPVIAITQEGGTQFVLAPAASVSVSTPAPTLTPGTVTVTPAAATIAATSPAPTLTTGTVTIDPAPVAVIVSTPAPAVTSTIDVSPGPATVTVTAIDPALTAGAAQVSPAAATVSVSGLGPVISITVGFQGSESSGNAGTIVDGSGSGSSPEALSGPGSITESR